MSAVIPEDAQRLVVRLRQAADEIESAARYGVPIPFCVTVGGHAFGDASFSATEEEFAAWADYTEATVEDYVHERRPWSRAVALVNGLPLSFAVERAAATEAAS